MRYGNSTQTISHVGATATGGGGAGVPGPQGPAGAAGADGADGDSAYQIAVANGFVGTEPQWLASLVGADGADGAVGPQGPAGPAGAGSSQVITSSYTHTLSSLSVGDTFYVSDTGMYQVWQGTGFIEFAKDLQPLSVDSIESDNSFADIPSTGSAGSFRYSPKDGDHLYIHDGTDWHHINGA